MTPFFLLLIKIDMATVKSFGTQDGAATGVDLIVEMLANRNLGSDLTVLNRGGTVAVVGSRGEVNINPRDLMQREAQVVGVMGGTPEEVHLIAIICCVFSLLFLQHLFFLPALCRSLRHSVKLTVGCGAKRSTPSSLRKCFRSRTLLSAILM